MGYTLKIGQLKTSIEGEKLEMYINHDVIPEHHDKAPAYGEPTDFTNSRWPSYTAWHNSMDFIGLTDLFYNDQTGLLKKHPATVELTEDHRNAINEAHKAFYLKYPNCKPGFSPKVDIFDEDPDWPKENGYAVRLEWLKYWVDWALENCEDPVFYNS